MKNLRDSVGSQNVVESFKDWFVIRARVEDEH